MIQEAIINGLIGIVVAVITVLASGLRHMILAKTAEVKAEQSDTEWALVQSIALTVVQAVEQIAKTVDLDSQQKYAKAIELLSVELAERGISLTQAQQQVLVESGVKALDEVHDTIVDVVTR